MNSLKIISERLINDHDFSYELHKGIFLGLTVSGMWWCNAQFSIISARLQRRCWILDLPKALGLLAPCVLGAGVTNLPANWQKRGRPQCTARYWYLTRFVDAPKSIYKFNISSIISHRMLIWALPQKLRRHQPSLLSQAASADPQASRSGTLWVCTGHY